jgi:2-methylcitrate dehydratase
MSFVDDFSRWATQPEFGATPPAVAERAKLLLVDALACALAARAEDAAAPVMKLAEPSSVMSAALANGALIRALDFNDYYWGPGLGGHPSDNIGVMLAVGEWRGASGKALLETMVVGYEAYCKVLDAMPPRGPWDHTSVSTLVVPVIAGRLMNLPPAQVAEAMAISAAHGLALAALREGHLSTAKGLANALIANGALLATLLAAEGATGPREALDGERGLQAGLFRGANPARILEPLSGDYRLMQASVKAFPCFATAQAAVAAAIAARTHLDGGRIRVHLADVPIVRAQASDASRKQPRTRADADHSFFYLVAAALCDGELTLEQYARKRWMDADVRGLIERMELLPDLSPPAAGIFPCRIEVGSHSFAVEKNPIGMDDVAEKFRRYGTPLLGAAQCEAALEAIARLERLDSVAPLARLIASSGYSTA